MNAWLQNSKCSLKESNSGVILFFIEETRNNGFPECWTALQNAVNSKSGIKFNKSDDEINIILSKVKVTPLSGSIQMCIDQKGNKY